MAIYHIYGYVLSIYMAWPYTIFPYIWPWPYTIYMAVCLYISQEVYGLGTGVYGFLKKAHGHLQDPICTFTHAHIRIYMC